MRHGWNVHIPDVGILRLWGSMDELADLLEQRGWNNAQFGTASTDDLLSNEYHDIKECKPR